VSESKPDDVPSAATAVEESEAPRILRPGASSSSSSQAELRPSVGRAASEGPSDVGRRAVPRAPVVHVVGFWKRAIAALVDFVVVVPVAALVILIVSKAAGISLPASNMRPLDVDMWIDLAIATDPALVMAASLFVAIGLAYLFVFHITLGRTLGMRLMKIRVIDVYGDRPGPGRCAARCAGYMASVGTLFLGFLWMGFDSEKRALQDWIAGTYVIRG
jgi:uncharacterized RDD family membrane protein YckC